VENALPSLVPSIAGLGPTVLYQNVTSLRTSHKFLAGERNEMNADILILAETRVLEADAPLYPLPGFDYSYFRTEGKG
jgi:exonuclease III